MNALIRRPWLWIGVMACAIASLYVGMMLAETNGRIVAPLDDAYIHFQYTRQMAMGQLWQYNVGETPTTGGTSLLYPVVLTLFYWVGFRGEWLVVAALLVGVVSFAFSAVLVYGLTRQLLLRTGLDGLTRLPLVTTLLFLLTGAVQWGYLNGMESGLFTLWILAAFNAYVKARVGQMGIYITLAALTRPEGIFLVGMLWLVTVWVAVLWQQWRQPQRWPRVVWIVSVALLASLLPLLVNWWLTGSVAAAGAQAKSWFGNVPFRLGDIIGSVLGAYWDILARLALGLWAGKAWFVVPGMLPLALVGWWQLWRQGEKATAVLSGGWFFLGTLSTATLITSIWQYGRYQLPFLALIFPIAAVGVATFGADKGGEASRRLASFRVALFVGVLVVAGYTTLTAWRLYRQSVWTVSQQALLLADWVYENVPDGVAVAVHDAGAIRYVGQRPIYDLIGLTTPGQAAVAWKHGMGAVYELMERLPEKPAYFATYPDVFSIPYLTQTGLLAEVLFRAEVVDYSPITAASGTQVVYGADWQLADSGNRLYQADMRQKTNGRRLVQRIDVADLESEAVNDFSWWEGAVLPGFATDVQQFRYRTDDSREVLDGGRLVTGGLAWQTAVVPHQPLLITARLHAQVAGSVQVRVDGQVAGRWRYPALPGEWLETAFLVPADLVKGEQVMIELIVPAEATSHYALYHLWVWQGEGEGVVVAPETAVAAQLGDDIRLLGYTLRGESVLDLTLYWQTERGTEMDAKVFVHLYDEVGALVAQQDGRPYGGTRPPYTWAVGEVVADPYRLGVAENGRYQLVVGLYEPNTGVRLPVQVAGERLLSDERILLSVVRVAGVGQE